MATDLKTLTPGTAAASSVVVGAASTASASPSLFTSTGSGNVVLSTSPTLTTPNLGTPSALTLTNATGLPISTGVSGLGTGIATALAVNTGSAGAPVLFNGALGTPSSGTLTNATGLPVSTGVSGLGTGVATALAVNVGSAGAPVLFNGAGGTPTSLTLTNATGLPVGGISATGTPGATNFLRGDGSWQVINTTLTVGSTATSGGASGQIMFDTGSVLSESSALTFASNTLQINGVNLLGSTAKLQLGAADAAAPVAQTLQVQSVVAGTLDTAGTNFTIRGSASTGSGNGGSIVFTTSNPGTSGTAVNAPATRMIIYGSSNLVEVGNNTVFRVPFGVSNFGGGAVIWGQNILRLSTDSYPTASNTVDLICRGNGILNIEGTVNTTIRIGGSDNTFPALRRSSTTLQVRLADNTGYAPLQALSLSLDTDVILARDAANTLALRNGTNAQRLNIYNNYSSSANYETYSIDWITTANTALVGPRAAGTGTQRVQRLQYLEDGGSGSTTPSLGTTCPAASATVKSWIKVLTSDGTTAYIPCWA